MDLSPISTQWEGLFSLYSTGAWVVGVVVIGLMLYLIMRYRSKPGAKEPEDAPQVDVLPPQRGAVKVAIIMTIIITGILFTLTLSTMATVDLIEKTPESAMVVKVEAFQWGWKFIYPDGREVIGELRVPKGQVIVFEVTSTDVFHNLGFVEFKVKADAIPGRVTHVWLQPQQTGEYDIRCYELCGVGHTLMTGKLIVMEPDEFEEWYLGS